MILRQGDHQTHQGDSLAFQTPITIKEALDSIHRHDYALPAIQREFVWSRDRICMLFDSLMHGYPIGSFLFWRVLPENSTGFVFYDFIRHYHALNAKHCPRLDLPEPRALTAILDGQQRLTALNIGLCGSHAEKLPRLWHNNPHAYPKTELYLDLCHHAEDEELGQIYRFAFLTAQEAASPTDGEHWYRVGNVLALADGPPMFKYIQEKGLADHPYAYETLWRLHRIVQEDKVIAFYDEKDQELDKVLHIFIRVNSQGEPLSHSDLLLSIATAQWEERDARETMYSLVDELNQEGQGFAFSKDLLLKVGLVMTDASDVRFKVANFNRVNMGKLEFNWDRIQKAVRLAVRLLASFGFSERTLSAHSVLVPIADYLYQREAGDSYLTSAQHQDDRAAIRLWVIRSLLKSGIWGSGLDTLLSRLRRVIRDQPKDMFPVGAIEQTMRTSGKSLRFEPEEIEDLVETPYGDKRVFPILALLYPGANVQQSVYHEDHIFPKSRFTRARLLKAGVPEAEINEFIEHFNLLPNLQLLPGPANTQKQATLPLEWWRRAEPDNDVRHALFAAHHMHDLPADITDFLAFYTARRGRMLVRLQEALGVTSVAGRAGSSSEGDGTSRDDDGSTPDDAELATTGGSEIAAAG